MSKLDYVFNPSDPFGRAGQKGKPATAPAAAKPAPEPEPVKPVAAPSKTSKTKVQLAIEYLEKHGTATTADLRKLLGIDRRRPNGKQMEPRNYLTSAIRNGRIKRMGSDWVIGDGVPPPAVKAKPVKKKPVKKSAPAAKPARPAEVKGETAQSAVPAAVEPSFACALWSNGSLQIVRDGGTLALLAGGEVEQLRGFLESMRPR